MSHNATSPAEEGVRLNFQAMTIASRADFVTFVRALGEYLQRHPEEGENRDLPTYLEALAAWTEDMDGYYLNRGEEVPGTPDWKMLGQMLLAARVYE